MIDEISHKFIEEINFQDFVKFYINHRPTFGVSLKQFKEAFQTFGDLKNFENPILSKDTFLDVLFGKGKSNQLFQNYKFYGK